MSSISILFDAIYRYYYLYRCFYIYAPYHFSAARCESFQSYSHAHICEWLGFFNRFAEESQCLAGFLAYLVPPYGIHHRKVTVILGRYDPKCLIKGVQTLARTLAEQFLPSSLHPLLIKHQQIIKRACELLSPAHKRRKSIKLSPSVACEQLDILNYFVPQVSC